MKIKLVFDSSVGYDQVEAAKLGIAITPFMVENEGQTYRDGVDITPQEFYKMLSLNNGVTTSQPNVGETINLFTEILKDYDHIIYCTLPQESSGTYNQGLLAAQEFNDDQITVLDTKTAIGGSRMLVDIGLKMIKENKTKDEIISVFSEVYKNSLLFIVPFNTERLVAGGRLGNFAASFLNVIKMKVCIYLSLKGKMERFALARTDKRLYEEMLKKLKSEGYNDSNTKIYLIETDDEQLSCEFKKRLLVDFPNAVYEKMYLVPALVSHTGNRTYAAHFVKFVD